MATEAEAGSLARAVELEAASIDHLAAWCPSLQPSLKARRRELEGLRGVVQKRRDRAPMNPRGKKR